MAKSRDTVGVSSFLAWMCAINKQRAIIPVSAPPVKLGCGFSLPLFRRSFNVTAQIEAMIGADGLPILFGQDWPYFDQRKWPITANGQDTSGRLHTYKRLVGNGELHSGR